jgi:hypothetical protein
MTSSNSQAYQDLFVLNMLNHKRNGTFLEIGSNHPITNNNTFILESMYDWNGLLIDYDACFEQLYRIYRPLSIYQINDARKINYRDILDTNNFPTNIDYLQIDLDVDNKSTLDTLSLLNDTVFDKYKFATITFEHDIYTGNYFNTQEISRRIFLDRGYVLLFPNVSVFCGDTFKPFEDWYVHPDLVDVNIINKFITTENLTTEQIYKLFSE